MKHYEMDGHAVGLLREESGLSRADLAEQCDVASSYIALLENGARQPSAAIALKIANALNVKFTDIARAKEPEPAKAAS